MVDSATINRLLEGRVKDLASSKRGETDTVKAERRIQLQRSLNLWPEPARTDLRAFVTGTLQGEGFRIEKLRYESQPGLLVTAHLYLPDQTSPAPLIISSHGIWKGKKANPAAQARGISFALRGFATLIVDAPGSFGDDLSLDERGGIGSPGGNDLLMGSPWVGVYAWDLIRGLDAVQVRTDLDFDRVGITGDGDGGVAGAFAFVLDPRIKAAAFPCSLGTMEKGSLEAASQLGIGGLALAGDFSDVLELACPKPIWLGAAAEDARNVPADVERTAEKLRQCYRGAKAEGAVSYESFEGGADYNRRMRESCLAFFSEHLWGDPPRRYLDELRPLTDSVQNPSPSGTMSSDDPSLLVTSSPDRSTRTFIDLLDEGLAAPYPEPFHPMERLVPWLKYGPVNIESVGKGLTISDEDVKGAMVLPWREVDYRLAVLSGLSVAEVFAQLLHLLLPGRPESWESQALSGDTITSMIASMKTLFNASSSEPAPEKVLAQGPVSSLVVMFFKLYRDQVEIEVSHEFRSWSDLRANGNPALLQPLARYTEWPFST